VPPIPEPGDSYFRCLRVPAFFERFYARFLASDPDVPRRFVGIEWREQTQLLRRGLAMLLLVPTGNGAARAALEDVGRRHGPAGLDVPDRLYDCWVASFLATVRECDAHWSDAVEDAWRRTLQDGVAVMQAAALTGPGGSGRTR